MTIQILGAKGCIKCTKLEERVNQVLEEIGMETEVEKVNNPVKIAEYGVSTTPGLVIDEEVVSSGKMLSKDEIKEVLN